MTIHVVDPGPPGAGLVWRPSQSRRLLMNTVASQVTVFTDASVTIEGPLEEGPSLYQWAASLAARDPRALVAGRDAPGEAVLAQARALGPDSYPTRVLYGQYLSWVFHHVTGKAAGHVTVRVHRARAVRLADGDRGLGGAGPQTVVLEDGTELSGLSAVVLAQGHTPTTADAAERELPAFASRNGLVHIAPSSPADVDLSRIAPGQTVLVRGLGLNFFDCMALFTQGRGGFFERVEGRLVYRPSGREPALYAGSRRGVPYQARGENEKGRPRALPSQAADGRVRRRSLSRPVRHRSVAADRPGSAVRLLRDADRPPPRPGRRGRVRRRVAPRSATRTVPPSSRRRASCRGLTGLSVRPERMRGNTEATGGQLVSERVPAVLAPALGKAAAKQVLSDASAAATADGRPLADVLAEVPQVRGRFTRAELAALLDPAAYTGVAAELVDRAPA
ncbi:hypothetical protein GCM10022384_57820 [Streptomyces marokkonensis]|uniref:Adenylosuccinate lyase C-terminal domain-containing protein n=1 Tax=Streptomyces marokkonensis TaxID=324855 RepID=A0ABP7RXY4_9ACTN